MPAKSLFALVVLAAVAWQLTDTRLPWTAPTPENACGDSSALAWDPATPRRGALFRVRLTGAPDSVRLSGVAAGEPLHFAADTAGSALESLAPVPIDAPDSMDVVVRCATGSRADSLLAHLHTASGDYKIEKLRVAPAFGRPPDSATAARIARESRRAVEVAQNAHATPRLWRAPFAVPRESRITSGFGHGREFNGAITSRHMGTDFAGATGAPVRAANRGVVRIVDTFFYGGNVVYLDHGAGLTSAYLHLSKHDVAAGDTVERGQTVGRVGATGRVTGPHLHLIVRYGAVTVDPESLFELAGEGTAGRR